MEPWQIAILIKPFVALAFFGLIVLPIKMLFERVLPEGRIKRLLFKRIG
jgi:hypothetical protein